MVGIVAPMVEVPIMEVMEVPITDAVAKAVAKAKALTEVVVMAPMVMAPTPEVPFMAMVAITAEVPMAAGTEVPIMEVPIMEATAAPMAPIMGVPAMVAMAPITGVPTMVAMVPIIGVPAAMVRPTKKVQVTMEFPIMTATTEVLTRDILTREVLTREVLTRDIHARDIKVPA